MGTALLPITSHPATHYHTMRNFPPRVLLGALALFVLTAVTATSVAVAVSRVQFLSFDQAIRAAVTRADYPTAASDASEGWMNGALYNGASGKWHRASATPQVCRSYAQQVQDDGFYWISRINHASANLGELYTSQGLVASTAAAQAPIIASIGAVYPTSVHVYNADGADTVWCCASDGVVATGGVPAFNAACEFIGTPIAPGGTADFDGSDFLGCTVTADGPLAILHITVCGYN